jgi:hypothetical protein
MADLDPFGRKKGEDPLASLGWTGREGATEAEPAPKTGREEALPGFEPEPERPAQPLREPRPRRERQPTPGAQFKPGRAVRGIVLTVVVVAIAGGAIASLVGSGVNKVERFVDDFTTPRASPPPPPASSSEVPSGQQQPTPAQPAQPVQPARPAAPPRGVGRGSLLRPFAFGAAIKRLRNGGYGRLTNLRVAPERIDATLLTKGGALRQVQIVPGGDLRQFGTSSQGFSGVPTMSLAGIDAGAPQRLTRSAAERLGVAPSRVNYLVYTQFAGTAQWNVYFTAGQIFSADAHGRITRRIS